MDIDGKRIISVDDLSDGDVNRLFFHAHSMRDQKCIHDDKTLKNAVLMTAFFEPSTRTRLSFEMAALRLGVRTLAFHALSSSMAKGECEHKTITNLLALQPDILVIRRDSPFELPLVYKTTASIINGGDGVNEHPTQALLDCFTLLDHFRCDSLRGLRILIIGDVAHSRVAHSNIKLMSRLLAEVWTLTPAHWQVNLVPEHRRLVSFADVPKNIDVVMCLRVQKERLLDAHAFSEQIFSKDYCLTASRLDGLGNNCVVLHPGPINLGAEIAADVANHPRSLINEQVKNGVLVRAALIKHCLS